MKSKSFMSILLLTILFKNIYQQPIIIPLDPDFDEEDFGKNKDKDLDLDKEIEKELGPIKRRNNNVEKEEEMDQPIVETKELRDSNGNNIRITRIHYHRTKNLHGNNMNSESEAITPIQMMRIFDSRINSIFEDFIRQSIGIKMLLNGLSMIDEDEDEEEIEPDKKKTKTNEKIPKDFELEEGENTKNKVEKKNTEKKEKEEKNKNKNKNKGEKKFEVSKDNLTNKVKGKKKLSRRELIFSRVCKYIFYSIIIFTIYILIKKLLEILEIIDPDNAVEIKIENDEESKLKKTIENKQN